MRRGAAPGFTYVGLIVLVAIIALVGAAGVKTGALMQRVAAEEELLEIGNQFSEALRSYAAATPAGQPQQPPSLQELLKDPRFPNVRRHLRKIYVDPITGKAEWGIVYLGDKVGVLGVYSLSDARPFKVANFDIRFPNMENRERISDWKFMIAGGDALPPQAATPANSMTAPPSLFADPNAPPPPKEGVPPPPPPPPPPVEAQEPKPEAEEPKPEGEEPAPEVSSTEKQGDPQDSERNEPEATQPPPERR